MAAGQSVKAYGCRGCVIHSSSFRSVEYLEFARLRAERGWVYERGKVDGRRSSDVPGGMFAPRSVGRFLVFDATS